MSFTIDDFKPGMLFWEKNQNWGLFFVYVEEAPIGGVHTRYIHTLSGKVISYRWTQRDVDHFFADRNIEIHVLDPEQSV